MKRSELKSNAKEQLRGNWFWAVGLCLVGAIMASLTSSFSVGILGGMVLYGVTYTFLTLAAVFPELHFSGHTVGILWLNPLLHLTD